MSRKWAIFTVTILVIGSSSVVVAEDDANAKPAKPARPIASELKDKQVDISLEARDIERIVGKLKKASDLSKQRITEAAGAAEEVSTALNRNESETARASAKQTSEMLKEVMKQLEALLAEDTPQQVAAAKNLAQELSQAERRFLAQVRSANVGNPGGRGQTDPDSKTRPQSQGGQGGGQTGGDAKGEKSATAGDTENSKRGGKSEESPEKKNENGAGGKKADDPSVEKNGGKGSDEENDSKSETEQREGLARRAEQLAESGQTLLDVLKAIQQSTDPEDQDAAKKIDEILKETDLENAIKSMRDMATKIRNGEFADVNVAGLDLAERLEIASQRLDSAYRVIVAPRAEELRAIEKALVDLEGKLNELESPSQVLAWHRQTRELLDRLDELGISEKKREEFLDEMKASGFGVGVQKVPDQWIAVSGRYVAPKNYAKLLVQLEEDVQARLQLMIVGELGASSDEVTPPKYQTFVEQYYKVLSKGSQGASSPMPAARRGAK